MDTSTRFFAKLRSLAVTLETERTNLEHTASQNLDEDEGFCIDEVKSGAVRALHELHSEVRALKRQFQSQVASQEDGSIELRSFIKACMMLKQRTTEDIERIQRHYEKYGYKQLKGSVTAEVNVNSEADTRSHLHNELETGSAETVAGDEKKEVEALECETPVKTHAPADDLMRTPQLSDFGLSSLHLQMMLGNTELAHEVVPAVALTPPPLVMTMQEFQPKTPRCSLRMDEDALTPRLEDFGITENTMCLNNDFTMDLFRKKPPRDRQTNSETRETAQRPPHSLPTPPSCVAPGSLSNDSMESPEVPVFSTFDFKINKHLGSSVTTPNRTDDPQSPTRSSNAAATPELPAFETPYISKLISAKKETKNNERENHTSSMNSISDSSECPVRVSSSDVRPVPVSLAQNEDVTPEMPRLQSFFGSSLPCIGGPNQSALTEPAAPVLQTDDEPTQDWCLATPRVRMEFGLEPRTPEMPDMSSITQDIFKLVSQANKQAPTAVVQPSSKASVQALAHGKENRAQWVAQVSEKDFNGLASYMTQIPLPSLNLAIKKINQVLEERRRDGEPNFAEFHMEDLRRVLEAGPQAPMYILCLVELKRLENVQGFGRNATFKVLSKV
ncbi:spindle and kinetochore-associated protein 3 [Trichomycterus rosablanca]|uniref:spindle and kinetochore-associated protein 3 n=1 Tax=Trichomycterus rosablanca TaxID=2290929 RepID=UPI002F35781A